MSIKTYKNKVQNILTQHKWQIRATLFMMAINIIEILLEFTSIHYGTRGPSHAIPSALSYAIMVCVLVISLVQCITKQEAKLYQQYDHAGTLFIVTAIFCLLYPAIFDQTRSTVLLCTHVASYSVTAAIITKLLVSYMRNNETKSNRR